MQGMAYLKNFFVSISALVLTVRFRERNNWTARIVIVFVTIYEQQKQFKIGNQTTFLLLFTSKFISPKECLPFVAFKVIKNAFSAERNCKLQASDSALEFGENFGPKMFASYEWKTIRNSGFKDFFGLRPKAKDTMNYLHQRTLT